MTSQKMTLSTQYLEYLIDFFEFFSEHREPDPNIQVAKIANLRKFLAFFLMNFKVPLAENQKRNFLYRLLRR